MDLDFMIPRSSLLQTERMTMGTCPTKTDKTMLQGNDMDTDGHDSHRTLFDALPFVTTFLLGLACAFVLPVMSWPLVAGLAALTFISGRRLERRLAEDRLMVFRQAVLASSPAPDNRPTEGSLTKETG